MSGAEQLVDVFVRRMKERAAELQNAATNHSKLSDVLKAEGLQVTGAQVEEIAAAYNHAADTLRQTAQSMTVTPRAGEPS